MAKYDASRKVYYVRFNGFHTEACALVVADCPRKAIMFLHQEIKKSHSWHENKNIIMQEKQATYFCDCAEGTRLKVEIICDEDC